MAKLTKSERAGTVHDAKNELLQFFKHESEYRDNPEALAEWSEIKKAIRKFNKKIRDKRHELEDEVRAGKNVKLNMEYLRGEKRVDMDLPKSVTKPLAKRFFTFKLKNQILKEAPYDYINNKINFFEGKDFDFTIDTGFGKHKLSVNDVRKMVVMSESNIVEVLINLYKKDFERVVERDKKKLGKKEFASRKKVYDKIEMVIAHNLHIATDATYDKKLGRVDKKGNFKKKGKGEYPMLMEFLDEVISLKIP